MHRDARYEGISELRIGVESFVHRDARYEGISELRIGVESFVQQVARYGVAYNALPLRIKKARHFHVVLFC